MSKHPFEGEGFDRDRALRFWDDIAFDYEGCAMQGSIPGRIVQRLCDMGVLGPGTDAIEFGCGPGTYSIPISKRVRSLTCVDTSEKMLSLLSD